MHTPTSLSVSGATLELHVDTVKVGIFLLHGLVGFLLWVQAACSPHKGRSTLKGPVSLSDLCRVLPMGGALSQGPIAYRLALTPGP